MLENRDKTAKHRRSNPRDITYQFLEILEDGFPTLWKHELRMHMVIINSKEN